MRNKLVNTDHFSLIFKFKNIPMKVKSFKKTENPVIWNTNKEGGWNKYFNLTQNSKTLDEIAECSDDISSDEMMTQISRRMEKVKFQCFGKVTKKVQNISTDKELDKLYELKSSDEANKEDIDKQISNKILAHQLKEYEKKLHYLNKLKKEKGSSAAVFKLKEKIVGTKKISQEAVSMKDPDTGEIIVENDKLKEASIKYVSSLLTNRSPKEEFEEEFKVMESLHEVKNEGGGFCLK